MADVGCSPTVHGTDNTHSEKKNQKKKQKKKNKKKNKRHVPPRLALILVLFLFQKKKKISLSQEPWLTWNSLRRPGRLERSAGTKDVHHHTQLRSFI
ncbi:rCG63677, partial [Rattus norvegicus]